MAYLPPIYEEFRRDYPEIAEAYDSLASKCHEAGPLDQRARRLVKLAMAVGCESSGAVRSHVRTALDEGISRVEIEHAIVLGISTVGLPPVVAALKWCREVFESRP
jgi:4-carboxymuconolactone decarboxylase